MKVYETRWCKITPADAERTTRASVWFDGRRFARITSWLCFFDTWEEAYQHLLTDAENSVASAERELNQAKDMVRRVMSLEKGQV
jgi:hypothetical protein